MKNLFFLSLIFILIIKNMCDRDCQALYTDCFNCTTCGEEVSYYEECDCLWKAGDQKCENVPTKISISQVYEAFYSCTDSNSKSIQNKFCGSTTINIDKEYNFEMPFIDERYGTQSIYCEYILKASDDDDVYYNINYNFNKEYSNDFSAVHLFFIVKYSDTTSIFSDLSNPSLNKDFHTVNEIIFKVYLEKGFPTLPFSFIVTRKNDNSKIALYITIGTILFACIICAISIYCLSKRISEKARLRQQALFQMAMAHQQRAVEVEEEDEYEQEKRMEEENKLKIEFALKNYLKPKKYLKKNGAKDGNTCTICIEDFKDKKSRISTTPCKHQFHYKCISNWLIKNVKNPKCPNCNYNLIQDVKDSDINKAVVINPERIQVTKPIRVSPLSAGEVPNSDNIRISEDIIIQNNIENDASRNANINMLSNNTENQNMANTQGGNSRNNIG